jgi:hypothetical protein
VRVMTKPSWMPFSVTPEAGSGTPNNDPNCSFGTQIWGKTTGRGLAGPCTEATKFPGPCSANSYGEQAELA